MKKKIVLVLSHILVAMLATTVTLYMISGQENTKLQQLSQIIQDYYVEDVDMVAVEDAAAHAMVAQLGDRWSYYIPASEYAAHMEQMRNAYVGIGITILQREAEDGFDILSVEENGPAFEVGIRPEDRLIAVEGQSVCGMDANEVRNLVRGEEGTLVEITILRDGEEIPYRVERRSLQIVVAEGELLSGNIGLVTIYNFDDRCAEESIAAIETLQEQGAEKLIFDVRYNGGGFAHEMVALLDYLLPEGDLFRTVNYAGKDMLARMVLHEHETLFEIYLANDFVADFYGTVNGMIYLAVFFVNVKNDSIAYHTVIMRLTAACREKRSLIEGQIEFAFVFRAGGNGRFKFF